MFGCESRKSGVVGGMAREGVALLVIEKVNKWVVEWKEVSSRIMWVKNVGWVRGVGVCKCVWFW